MTTAIAIRRAIASFVLVLLLNTFSWAQKISSVESKSDSLYQGEVSCGTCMFKMKGNGCQLAVKINEKFYFVEGSGIDDFGDAHAKDGFCNAIRKAEMKGEFKKEVFVAKKITLSKD
jgi:hypothetical protein